MTTPPTTSETPASFKERLRDPAAVSIGIWSSFTDPLVAHVLASAGYDWFCIDEQHGNAGPADSMDLLAAAGGTDAGTLVRLAWNRPELIGRALDSGADGVIVPMVQNADEAALAARASRYAPAGQRSWGPGRLGYALGGRDPLESNDRTLCFVMAETPEAVENVEEIAAVNGVDGIFLGPFDLSIAYQISVDELLEDASPDSPLARVVRACRANGIVAGGYAGSPMRAKALVERGFSMVAVAADAELLTTAARDTAAAARDLLG